MVVNFLSLLYIRIPENVDTPSPTPLTQIQSDITKVDPKEDFLYGTHRSTMQGLKDATTVSI
jgi:hypothetical protein